MFTSFNSWIVVQIKRFAACLCTGASIALVSASAFADVRLVYQQSQLDKPKQAPVAHSVEISAPYLRLNHGDGYVLFDAERQLATMVDTRKQQYTPMTRAQLERTGKSISQAMAQAQAMMKSLPPEQQKRIQQMMGGAISTPNKAARYEYKTDLGSSQAGGHACSKMQVLKSGKPWMNLCVAAPDELGISNSDYAVLKSMSNMLSGMLDQLHGMGFSIPNMNKITGIPVQTRNFSRGTSQLLVKISHSDIAAEHFKVPAGYAKQAMPSLH